MTSAAWALAGVALLVVPLGERRPSVADHPTSGARGLQSPAALWVAVAGLGCACLAAFGVPTGLGVAVVVCPVAAKALRTLRSRPVPLVLDRSVALALDLTAAALRSGGPLAEALRAAAPAAGDGVRDVLLRVAGLLRLGASPEQAWAGARDGPLRPVAVAAIRSAQSGIRLAATFERLAEEIRAEATTAALTRAHRAGVHAMAPLGACFLPSFVCLGIVPVVVGIAGSVTGVLP